MKTNLFDLIDEIERRPGMYFSPNSIFVFHGFLAGIKWGTQSPEIIDVLEDFQNWIAKKYSITLSVSWASIIRLHSHDEIDAMKRFFVLWKEFNGESGAVLK